MPETTPRELGRHVREARKHRGKTQEDLAELVRLDRTIINKIESGSRKISALELSAIAQALDVRMSWFFRKPVPADVSHRSSQGLDTVDSKIDDLLADIADDAELVQGLAGLPTPPAIDPWEHPSSRADAEHMGADIRKTLRLDHRQPLTMASDRAADIGFYLFSRPLGHDTADAGTLLLRRGAVSLVNSSNKVSRRRLAAVHELCHFLVGDDYIIDWRVAGNSGSTESLFDFAARAALLPRESITDQWQELRRSSGTRTSAVRIASKFQVDMSTFSQRLQDLDLIDVPTANDISSTRTTQADIIEFDLHPGDELAEESQPRMYQKQSSVWQRARSSAGNARRVCCGGLSPAKISHCHPPRMKVPSGSTCIERSSKKRTHWGSYSVSTNQDSYHQFHTIYNE